ncbi:MAG: hypothetical protein A3B44_03025 [Candidatus Levybacteria bacterium RIFCSPLOWO2_01_FULL_38_21]|nr:MAG: hypothetical protein A3B44_03025 [Candidatus Levybacteria bacterium RIFCSPLOWO2_01_FULL_38_21]
MGDKINNRVMIEDERIVAPDPLSETVELVQMTPEELFDFNSQARSLLLNAINKNGIFASEDPRFHHRFGRDTFITAYFIAESIKYSPQEELWQRTKKAVFNFWEHQLPNGQAPHEIKPFNKRDATKRFYYRNGDNLVNDDSVDATPLALIVTPMFIETEEELEQFIPKANKALDWMIQNIETYSGWLSYKYNRKNGGLVNQGWMDSKDSIKWRSIRFPPDPIALVEVQAYAWKALRVWSDIFAQRDPQRSKDLRERAEDLKRRFNENFTLEDDRGVYLAHGLDGTGSQIRSISINPGLGLWANYKGESIIKSEVIPFVVRRIMSDELFDETAGIRTFGRYQRTFDKEGYHSGQDVFWPVTSYMIADGLIKLGFVQEGEKVRRAPRTAIKLFGSFIEQFTRENGSYVLFNNGHEESCRNQTWTIAGFYLESSMDLGSAPRA